jgi:hypothetical protein
VNGLVVGTSDGRGLHTWWGPPPFKFHRILLQAVIGNTQGQSESLGLSAIRSRGGSRPPRCERGATRVRGPPPFSISALVARRRSSRFACNIRIQGDLEREMGCGTRLPSAASVRIFAGNHR